MNAMPADASFEFRTGAGVTSEFRTGAGVASEFRAGAVVAPRPAAERLRSRRSASGVALVSARRPFNLFASLAVAAVLAAPMAASAAPPKSDAKEMSDADKVRELMRTGVGEYKKGNLEAARDAFLKAWAIQPHYAIAASLAEVEMALGQYRSTAEHLEYYLSNLPEELQDRRPAAESQLAEAKKHLVALHVTTDVPDATIYVDGVAVVRDREVLVEPGSHVLMAELGDHRSKKELFVPAGESRDVKLELQPHAAPAESPPPPPAAAPKPVEANDSGAHRPVSVLIGGGALTLVAVGIGIGYSLDASSAQSDADRYAAETAQGVPANVVAQNAQCAPTGGTVPPACSALRDSLEQSNRSQNIATGAFVASGVLAVGTVVTYLLWPTGESKGDHARARVVPWTTGAAHGATARFDF